MFWRLELATVWRLNQVAKNACLAEIGAVFKSFSVFPRTFVTVHLLSILSPSQTLRAPTSNLHCCIFSAQILQVTGMGVQFWTHFYLFLCFSPWFFASVYVLEMGLCFGYCSLIMLSLRMLLLEFDLILVVSFLVFILCLAKCFFYFIWTWAVELFQNVPFEVVSFTVLNVHVLLCKSIGSIC